MGLLTEITENIQQYVVAPLASFGLGGYVFSLQGESVAQLSADITDHYTEDNRALQDHIAIHPKRITLKGYVGELIYSPAGDGQPQIATLTQKLTEISSFLPAITAAATQAQQAIIAPQSITFDGLLNTASNIYGLVKNMLGATGTTPNQQNAYLYFKALMQSATLMAIQTPWEFMTNMAIESITAIQPENTIYISDFAVSFKEIRIAQTLTTAFFAGGTGGIVSPGGPILQSAAALQGQPITNLGPTPGAIPLLNASDFLDLPVF